MKVRAIWLPNEIYIPMLATGKMNRLYVGQQTTYGSGNIQDLDVNEVTKTVAIRVAKGSGQARNFEAIGPDEGFKRAIGNECSVLKLALPDGSSWLPEPEKDANQATGVKVTR